MSLKQFKDDVAEGTSVTSRSSKKMAEDFRNTTYEARGSLQLLGDEIGVHIPRHLSTMIAKLPGVNTALAAAFSSVAVLALIEVVVKIIEKIAEFQKHAQEAAQAIKKAGEVGHDAIHKIDEEILSLNEQLAELNGHYLEALLDKLDAIDNQSLDQLVSEFDKLEKAADEALDKQKLDFFSSLLDLGKSNPGIDQVKRDLEQIGEAVKQFQDLGDRKELGRFLADNLARVNKELQDGKGLHEGVVKALEIERDRLQDMNRIYGQINEKNAKQKELAEGGFNKDEVQRIQAEGKAREELTQKVRQLADATRILLGEERTQQDMVIQKLNDQINKLKELDQERQREHPGIKTAYGEEINLLQQKVDLIKQEEAHLQALFLQGRDPSIVGLAKAPDLSSGQPKPIFGGTSAELEMDKIKKNGPEAQAALTKVLDSVQSINDKFHEQTQLLEQLHKQYPEVFNAEMLKKAKDAIDPVRQAWQGFGQDVGDTVKQALLFGRSWSDALKSVLMELVQVILKLTLMKSLGAASGGGGGFLGGLLGGIGSLFGGHRAQGGPVDSAHSYVVGENGPEWFTPGTSGTITPNGAGGGTVVYQNFDARGADVAAIQRLEGLIEKSKYDAVGMSVAAVRDRNRRS